MSLLDLIILILILSWLGGWGFKVGGNLVHLLLVIILILIIFRLLGGTP